MPVIIWRVTFFEKDETPIVDNMRRLRDAWVLAQPYPHIDKKEWNVEAWETVKAAFEEQKQTSMLVAWATCHTAHTIIDRIEAEEFPDDD
jgi:hypothetical protein